MKLKVRIAQATEQAVLCGRAGRWAWLPLVALQGPEARMLKADPEKVVEIRVERRLAAKKGLI